MEYLLDVVVPTYNHEKYIGQTLESIVTQQTNFPFRVIVADDCSKDNTRAIISEYAAKYPDIVFPVFHAQNKGALANGYYLLSHATSKYIATCDGDDYWTNPTKLQQQVGFLEAHEDFAMVFTDVDVLDEMNSGRGESLHADLFPKLDKDVFTLEDMILSPMNMAPTLTLLFRNVFPNPVPTFYMDSLSADHFIQIMVAEKGKVKYMRERMGVYRHHSGGVTKSAEGMRTGEKGRELLYNNLNAFYNYKYDALFKRRLLDMARTRLIFGAAGKKGMAKLKHYFAEMPAYLKYSSKINIKELLYYHAVLFFPFLLPKKK
jgi:glycosyltransferase involved in cell wall biosynthesis